MADWLFYIADSTDPTAATKLFDFVDYDPPTNTQGFDVADGNVDLGRVDPEQNFLHQPPAAGGVLATSLYPEVQMSFSLLCWGFTYDQMVAKLHTLSLALQQGGTIVWQPPGATEVRYIDFFPSSLPQFFRGQPFAMQKTVNLLLDDGLPVTITRVPWLRGPANTIVDHESIANSLLDGHITFTNPGNMESPMRLTIDPVGAGSEVVDVRIARKSTGDLSDFATLYQFNPGGTETLPNYWKRLWHEVIVPSSSDGLTGNYRVIAGVQLDDAAKYRFQLRWGNVSTDPMGQSNRVVELDNEDYDSWNAHADIPFGHVRFDEDGSSLTLELWGMSPENDNPTCNFGMVTLLPSDELSTHLSVPGFKTGKFGHEDIWGKMWDVFSGNPQRMNDDSWRLYRNPHAIEYNLGTLPEGQHVLEFHGEVVRGMPTSDDPTADVRGFSATIGHMYVKEAGSQIKQVPLRFLRGQPVTAWAHSNTKRIIFDADGSSLYKVGIEMTDNAEAGRRINVDRVEHWYIPFCDNGRQMVVDSYTREAFLADNSGARWLPLHAHGSLMRAAPGDNFMNFRMGYASHQAALHDAWDGGPLSKALNTPEAEVTIELVPFYSS